MDKKIDSIDIYEIAHKLYYFSTDFDASDYNEQEKTEKEQIIVALENIKSYANNTYSPDFWRTFLICLDTITIDT